MPRSMGGFQRAISLTIRWNSALPVKEAIVKLSSDRELEMSPQQIAELLKKNEASYIVGVSGVPISMLLMRGMGGRGRRGPRGARPSSILPQDAAGSGRQRSMPMRERLQAIIDQAKSQTFLKIKGREPIVAEAVHIQGGLEKNVVEAQSFRSASDIYFLFPRQGE